MGGLKRMGVSRGYFALRRATKLAYCRGIYIPTADGASDALKPLPTVGAQGSLRSSFPANNPELQMVFIDPAHHALQLRVRDRRTVGALPAERECTVCINRPCNAVRHNATLRQRSLRLGSRGSATGADWVEEMACAEDDSEDGDGKGRSLHRVNLSRRYVLATKASATVGIKRV